MKWTVKCSRQMGAGDAKLERSFSDTSRVGQRTVSGTQCSEGEVGIAGSTKTNVLKVVRGRSGPGSL